MKIGIVKETLPFETRVGLTPLMVKKYIDLGFSIILERGAGLASFYKDEDYQKAGAILVNDASKVFKEANIILKVSYPSEKELSLLEPRTTLIANLQALTKPDIVKALANKDITAFALELIPRISRAQGMDILSSQSNLAGYKAVIDAVSEYGRTIPMMMTAAGTITPAKVLVLGVGVAGLQAIATAKRLGAIVYATDIRPETKEQVESLGGRFTDNIAETIKEADIVICTALTMGKKAPILVTDAMLKTMKYGAVIADMAVESGGNCEGSVVGETVQKYGVSIMGNPNLPARVSYDASSLLARNYYNFIAPLKKKDDEELSFSLDDEIIKATLICKGGKVVNPLLNKDKGDKK